MALDLDELRKAAQERIKERTFAPETTEALKADLKNLIDGIARATSAVALEGPLKSRERASEKVEQDYNGDWYDLKDVVRSSIIAEDRSQLDLVAQQIRLTCTARNGMGLVKDLEVKPSDDPCGYSGLNFVVVMKSGRPTEIQANTLRMAYGRMKELSFSKAFSGTKFASSRSRIQAEVQVEGGLGHAFYEIYRVDPGGPNGQKAAELSKLYYRFVRGEEPASPNKIANWKLHLAAFRQANPIVFASH